VSPRRHLALALLLTLLLLQIAPGLTAAAESLQGPLPVESAFPVTVDGETYQIATLSQTVGTPELTRQYPSQRKVYLDKNGEPVKDPAVAAKIGAVDLAHQYAAPGGFFSATELTKQLIALGERRQQHESIQLYRNFTGDFASLVGAAIRGLVTGKAFIPLLAETLDIWVDNKIVEVTEQIQDVDLQLAWEAGELAGQALVPDVYRLMSDMGSRDLDEAEAAYQRAWELASQGVKDYESAATYLNWLAKAEVAWAGACYILPIADKTDKNRWTWTWDFIKDMGGKAIGIGDFRKIVKTIAATPEVGGYLHTHLYSAAIWQARQPGSTVFVPPPAAAYSVALAAERAQLDSLSGKPEITNLKPQCDLGKPVIGLAWSKVAGASQYEVYRNGRLADTLPAGTTSFVDRYRFSQGQRYEYTVRAKRGAVRSAPSLPVGAQPFEACPPAGQIRVVVDGRVLFLDVPPTLEADVTLVPLRALAETMGATVGWDGPTETATFTLRDRTVQVKVGSRNALVNGQVYQMLAAAQKIDDRTLVPLRFVAEALGARVEWDGDTMTVTITRDASVPAPVTNLAPRVTSVDPDSGSALGGYDVLVTGTGFSPGAEVFFGRARAPSAEVVTPTTIRAKVPAGLGTAAVTVRTKAGTSEANPPLTDFRYKVLDASIKPALTVANRCKDGKPGLDLTWTAVPGATRYVIFRGDLGLYATDGPETSYWVWAEEGATYSWQIEALSGSARGARSNPVAVTVAACRQLDAPVITSVRSKCDGAAPGIELQWTPVTGATHYEVFRDGILVYTTRSAGASFWNTAGVASGPTYAYQVRAIGNGKPGSLSDAVSAQAAACSTGGATAVRLTAAAPACDGTSPGIRLTWEPLAAAIRYEVYRDGKLVYVTTTAGSSFWNVAGLVTGESYAYKVIPVTASGRGSAANEATAVAPACTGSTATPTSTPASTPAAKPAAPILQAATPRCDGTTPGISLQWSAVPGASAYEVYRDGSLIYTTTTGGTTFWNVKGLTAGQSYSYQVRAVGGADLSNQATAVAPACTNTPPPSPTLGTPSLTFVSPECDGTTSGIRLQWMAVSGATSYQIYRNGALIYTTATSGTSFWNVTGLTAGQSYSYQVQAVSGSTLGSLSGSMSATAPSCNSGGGGGTPPTPPPPPPSPTLGTPSLTSVSPECDGTTSGIRLQWTAVSGASNYQIYRNGTQIYTTATSGTSFWNVTGLTAGQSYSYQVRAVSGSTLGSLSGSMSAAAPSCNSGGGGGAPPPPPPPPPPPSPTLGTPSLTSVSPECDGTTSGIRLQWTAVSGAANYQIYRNGALIYTTATSGTSFWNVTGLTAGQSYSYQVQAVSGSTSGSLSGSMSATAPSCSTSSSIQVGSVVTVTSSLRLRQCASTNDAQCPVSVTLPQGQTMTVGGGPVTADGYTWWMISGNVNGTYYAGWSVETYLRKQ